MTQGRKGSEAIGRGGGGGGYIVLPATTNERRLTAEARQYMTAMG